MLGHSTATSSSSASQYIRPDFLSPPSLDAQKSPLAMLAATCNSIGAPDLQKTIKSVELPPNSKRSSQSTTGGSENKRPRRSPDSAAVTDKSDRKHTDKSSHDKREISKESDREKERGKKESSDEKSETRSQPPVSDQRDERKSPKTPPVIPKAHSVTPPKSVHPAPLTATFSALSSPLMSDLHFASRMKPPLGMGGMGGMMPRGYCPDPFCFSCQQNLQHCSTNPGAVPMDYSALSSYSSLQNGLNANKHLICNWVGPGENYCGKRFLTSEELFAHLRTHTNLSISSLSSDPLQNSYSSYAAYLNRFPPLASAASRYSPLFKSGMPGMTSPGPLAGYPGMWPSGPTPAFFSPSPYSYYRPPF